MDPIPAADQSPPPDSGTGQNLSTALVSSLSHVTAPANHIEAISHSQWKGPWMKKLQHFIETTLGT